MSRRATVLAIVLVGGALASSLTILVGSDRGPATVATGDQPTTIASTAPSTTTTTVILDAKPGAPGIGDPYYPRLGNGGYDAQRYDLDLTFNPNEGLLSGTMTMTAVATQRLSAFNLDMAALIAVTVMVDGNDESFRQEALELIVELSDPIPEDSEFVVVVAYAGIPGRFPSAALPDRIGWFGETNSVYVMSEPDATSSWFPLNDHPSDKAIFSMRISVPPPLTAATNGVLVETTRDGANTMFVFEHEFPMAPYLVALGIGELERIATVSPDGIPIRDYIDIGVSERRPACLLETGRDDRLFRRPFRPLSVRNLWVSCHRISDRIILRTRDAEPVDVSDRRW